MEKLRLFVLDKIDRASAPLIARRGTAAQTATLGISSLDQLTIV